MAQPIVELAPHRSDGFAGRDAELAFLLSRLEEEGPTVTHIHGIAGIGKTRLVDQFIRRAQALGVTVVRLDCSEIEPTPDGFTAALAQAAGLPPDSLVDELIDRLRRVPGRIVLALDTYERFAALDAWLRGDLLPRLHPAAHIVLTGREPPLGRWLTVPDMHVGAVRSLQLGPLTEPESLALLDGLGVASLPARRISRVVHGHPLALTMAAALYAGRLDRDVEDVAIASVDQIARTYLAGVGDPITRQVLEAASVVRRITEPLIRAMLPEVLPADALERLRSLPFVEAARDGLVIHDAVRDTVATALRVGAPERHRAYRVSAWRSLRTEIAKAPPHANMWRLTADFLYLLEQPDVREAFFPAGAQAVAIEPARPDDEPDFRAIVERHEGPEGQRALLAWWEFNPESVKIVRGREGETVGISIFLAADRLDRRVATRDPIAARWLAHRRQLNSDSTAIFVRRWLDGELGEEGSATFGAFNLDLKRTYVEMRPHLRHVYVVAWELNEEVLAHLLWRDLPGERVAIDKRSFHLAWLDMGPASVEGWLSRIVANELGVADLELTPYLDAAGHELRLADRRVALSPLELRFLACLMETPRRVVSRAELVERVWGYRSDATSNVVESLVRGLRRKLGADAAMIETARGAGYRFRPSAGS